LPFRADSVQVAVDTSLLGYWKRQRRARERARRALPDPWLTDPRPEMQEVADTYVELLARRGPTHVERLPGDDR